MQSASSRIWARVAVSISHDDNDYTTGTSYSPRRNGWRSASDVTNRKRAEVCGRIERKLESWVLDAKRGGSTFGARWREANLHPMGAARDGGQMHKTA